MTNLPELSGVDTAMYERTGENSFRSSIHAQGAWNEHEQHMGPASGLIAHALEGHDPQEGLRVARISYEILGLIPGGEVSIKLSTERAGRTIQLIRAQMLGADGRVCIDARAWRLATSDTSAVQAFEDEPMPAPENCSELDGSEVWPGGYIAQLQVRQDPSSRPGRGRTWVSSRVPLLEAEQAPLGEFIRDLDAANGMVPRVAPGRSGFLFPNVDLQLHLLRTPQGEWKGLDTRVSFGADGVGLTSSVIHDRQGIVGHAEQTLTLRSL